MQAEEAKSLLSFLLPQLEQENRITKRILAAVPENQREYRPHAKARSALELAWHIASSEIWFIDGIVRGQFAPERPRMPRHIQTVADVCSWHDKNVPELIEEVRGLGVDQLLCPIEFDGIYNYPAVAYIQTSIVHSAHHRGQLAVYLRAMGANVPSIYGDTADEPFVLGNGSQAKT